MAAGCSSVVERRAGGPDVGGSIPLTPTKFLTPDSSVTPTTNEHLKAAILAFLVLKFEYKLTPFKKAST